MLGNNITRTYLLGASDRHFYVSLCENSGCMHIVYLASIAFTSVTDFVDKELIQSCGFIHVGSSHQVYTWVLLVRFVTTLVN